MNTKNQTAPAPEWSHTPDACTQHQNLIIESDNFDSLRLLRSTHAGRIRVAAAQDEGV